MNSGAWRITFCFDLKICGHAAMSLEYYKIFFWKKNCRTIRNKSYLDYKKKCQHNNSWRGIFCVDLQICGQRRQCNELVYFIFSLYLDYKCKKTDWLWQFPKKMPTHQFVTWHLLCWSPDLWPGGHVIGIFCFFFCLRVLVLCVRPSALYKWTKTYIYTCTYLISVVYWLSVGAGALARV